MLATILVSYMKLILIKYLNKNKTIVTNQLQFFTKKNKFRKYFMFCEKL